jgi:hypothetical protein
MELVVVGIAAVSALTAGIFRLSTGSWPIATNFRPARLALSFAAAILLLVAAIQLVPYGRDHSNPPILAEPAWDSERTRELTRRACFDCHSNEVQWPWYSNIAPLSWLVLGHVEDGRDELNLSEWGRKQVVDVIAESVFEIEMPPRYYTLLRSKGRLSDAERNELIQGLERTFGFGEGEGEDEDEDEDDDD